MKILAINKILKPLLILLLTLHVTTVNAVEVENLYTGKILVTDKSQPTRIKAHRWAIEQVLTKVTGSRAILENKTVQYEIRVKTANYIKSFAFVTDEQNRTFLIDKFDQNKIDALIRSVGASIWGQRRPLAAIWLVIEEGLNRKIITTEDYPQITELLNQNAENRGLPVVLPKMDDADSKQVFPSDVWAKFDKVVAAASERYEAEYFIMARLRAVDSFKEPEYQTGWLLDFSLFKSKRFLTSGQINGEQFYVLRELINALGDYFATEYSVRNNQISQDKLRFTVENLKSMVDFKQVERHLKELPPVRKVSLLEVNADQAIFDLWLNGQALDVIRAMSLLSQFEKVETEILNPAESLSVEEQLKLLTEDYKSQRKESVQETEKIEALRYKWLTN